MRLLKGIGKFLWRFMVIFSFIVNVVLVAVIVGLVVFIFTIKNDIAQPLVGGLYSSFVGLESATIDWTIPVRDRIPVVLNIPLQTDTEVVLTDNVPLQVFALIDLPGINAYGVNANVSLTLPRGLVLPVALDLNVPVAEELDVSLDVRAVIPLSETQLADPLENLQLLFDPLVRGLWNLPNNFDEAIDLGRAVLRGDSINLLEVDVNNTEHLTNNPWAGFSRTAGLNYTLFDQAVPADNVPLATGIVPTGGIRVLDEQVRPEVYADDNNPASVNAAARNTLSAQGIAPFHFDGTMATYYMIQQGAMPDLQAAVPPAPGITPVVGGTTNEFDLIITPESTPEAP